VLGKKTLENDILREALRRIWALPNRERVEAACPGCEPPNPRYAQSSPRRRVAAVFDY
jgi:hypothetical protein